MNRITTKITSVVIATILLALTGCTGSIPEGQSFLEDKTAKTAEELSKLSKEFLTAREIKEYKLLPMQEIEVQSVL